jgi:hypothetical protein
MKAQRSWGKSDMKQATFLLGIALLCAGSAAAQSNSAGSLSLAPTASNASQITLPAITPLDLALPSGVPAAPPPTSFNDALALPAAPAPSEPAEPQNVQGVFQNFDWQAYVGYTYVRFFEVPGIQVNTNGLNFGVVYYFKDWLGADGEFVGTFGTQYGDNAKFLMGMGGVRVRHAMEHNIEVWAHVLGGASKYRPETAFGKQTSVAYEVGGGVDLNTHRRRLAYRISVDAAGTAFFNTYQVSPKISAGVVFKF